MKPQDSVYLEELRRAARPLDAVMLTTPRGENDQEEDFVGSWRIYF